MGGGPSKKQIAQNQREPELNTSTVRTRSIDPRIQWHLDEVRAYICDADLSSTIQPNPILWSYRSDSDREPLSSTIRTRSIDSRIQWDTILNVSASKLEEYCPNWSTRYSYILPPRFEWKNSWASGKNIDKPDRGGATESDREPSMDRPFYQSEIDRKRRSEIDRSSADAERMVFEAIEQLIANEGDYHPFVAIHNFTIDKRLTAKRLQQILPLNTPKIMKFLENKDREYDYILIGPKVGIVIIEVKSSTYNGTSPQRFLEGMKQLDETDFLIDFLEELSMEDFDSTSIRKVLFAPNLEKARFEEWVTSGRHDHIWNQFESIQLCFKENLTSGGPAFDSCTQTPLHAVLRQYLSDSTTSVSQNVYTFCVTVLVGLESLKVTTTGGTGCMCTGSTEITLDISDLFGITSKAATLEKIADVSKPRSQSFETPTSSISETSARSSAFEHGATDFAATTPSPTDEEVARLFTASSCESPKKSNNALETRMHAMVEQAANANSARSQPTLYSTAMSAGILPSDMAGTLGDCSDLTAVISSVNSGDRDGASSPKKRHEMNISQPSSVSTSTSSSNATAAEASSKERHDIGFRQSSASVSSASTAEDHSSKQNDTLLLLESAHDLLDAHCPHWMNATKPRSYIIPPNFYFKHPRIPDNAILPAGDPTNRIHIDRVADRAEFIVFEAIQRVTEDVGDFHPFIAFRGVDIDRLRTQLEYVFPGASCMEDVKLLMREYDFILIGPKIGLIFIEVNASYFTQAKHFNPQHRYLPERYVTLLQRFRSVDAFTQFLITLSKRYQNRIGSWDENSHEKIKTRRILFTPNLKRSRVDEWLRTLARKDRDKNLEYLNGDVICWYEEDMQNRKLTAARAYVTAWFRSGSNQDTPPLYSTLREFLSDCKGMPSSLYESFASIIGVLVSVLVIPPASSPPTLEHWEIEKRKFSKFDPKLNTVKALEATEQELRKEASSNSRICTWKTIILTPAQYDVLKGPSHQFIVGAAGVGKTLILQSKALDLLKNQESLVVYASKHNLEGYKVVFGKYGFREHVRLEPISDFYGNFHEFTATEDNIILDDALDDAKRLDEPSKIFSSFGAAICKCAKLNVRTFWVAFDPHLQSEISQQLIELLTTLDRFRLAHLTEVMRYPETVFEYVSAIDPGLSVTSILEQCPPWTLGHKIYGARPDVIEVQSSSIFLSMESVSTEICRILDRLFPVRLDEICVIVCAGNWTDMIHGYLLDFFCKMDRNKALGTVEKGSLQIYKWTEVASLEWPVVIYVSYSFDNSDEHMHQCVRYRSCTRTTGSLFEIRASFS